MTTKETASALWQNLNQGLDALYQKYKNLKASSKTDYEAKIAAVDPQYDTLKNQAASQNKIAKANTDRRMAESGLAASGEALRRSLLQDAALQQNLTSLDLSARAEKSALRQDYDKALLELEAKEQDEVSKYTYDANEMYLAEVDREAKRKAAEQELQFKKEEAETANRLKEEELRLKAEEAAAAQRFKEEELRLKAEDDAASQRFKEEELRLKAEQQTFEQEVERALKAAQAEAYRAAARKDNAAAQSSSSPSKDKNTQKETEQKTGFIELGGVKVEYLSGTDFLPETVSPKALVDSVVSRNTTKDSRSQAYYDKTSIATSLRAVVNNTTLDKSFRYEVYLYGKALGFL